MVVRGRTIGREPRAHRHRGRSLRATVMTFAVVVVTLGVVTSATAEACQPPAELTYVAMGDSYASGYGLSDASGDCSRSTASSYPKRTQAAIGFGTFVDVSCSGARTTHFGGTQGDAPPQYDALNASVDAVSITIGGNDLGFTDIITNCATSWDCRDDYGGNTMPTLLADVANVVGPRVETVLRTAADRAPNAEIFLIGYPDLLPAGPTGIGWAVSCGVTATVISDSERTALRGLQAALNQQLAARAAAVGGRVHDVDVYTPSIGHDLCSTDNWTAGVATLYHPTELGHREIGTRLSAAIIARLAAVCAASTTTTSTSTTAPVSTTTTEPPTTTTAPVTTTTLPPVPNPNDPYISATYADFLGRPPTSFEREAGRTLLGGETPATTSARVTFVTDLANSDNYLGAVVNKMYRDTLGRDGEPGGVAYWTEEIRSKRRTVAQVGGQLYASNEYFQGFGGGDLDTWIGDLYQKLLLRPADAGGLAHWRNQAVTKGRNAVSYPMFQSNESARMRVDKVYLALLGRHVDADGATFWAPRIVANGDVVLAIDVAGSAEYLTRAATRFP